MLVFGKNRTTLFPFRKSRYAPAPSSSASANISYISPGFKSVNRSKFFMTDSLLSFNGAAVYHKAQSMDGNTNLLVQSPLRCSPVVSPIFIQRAYFIFLKPHERHYMKRSAPIPRIYIYCSDCQIIHLLYPLNRSIPFTRIFTICPDILFYRKMLIRAMPIHIGILPEISPYFLRILFQYGIPKFLYVHPLFSCLNIFKTCIPRNKMLK